MGKIALLPLKVLGLALLWIYQTLISPVLTLFGVRCRHEPTCSHYAAEAIDLHGPWRGGWMTLARLLRCHPFGTSGVDNVPETVQKAPFWAPWRYGRWRVPNTTIDKTRDGHGHDHIS